MDQHRFFFAHVPKTGGNSVFAALEKVTGGASLRMNNINETLQFISGNDARALEDNYTVLGGHSPAMLSSMLPYNWQRVVWIRDPLTRALSFYANMKMGKTFLGHRKDEFVDPISFLRCTDEVVYHGHHGYGYTLGWTPGLRLLPDRWTDLACENLRRNFSFIGLLDDPEGTERRFQEKFGVPLNLPRDNITPAPPPDMPNDERQMAVELLRREYEICTVARELAKTP